jgi:hypothetical protein
MTKVIMALALAVAALGCNSESSAKPQASKASLLDLSVSLDAARTEFNAHKQEARFLTLLAPT